MNNSPLIVALTAPPDDVTPVVYVSNISLKIRSCPVYNNTS